MAAHRNVNLLDDRCDLLADERIKTQNVEEYNPWAESEELMQSSANEARSTSASNNGGKPNESDHRRKHELEIGPYVSAERVVNNPDNSVGSSGDKVSENCLHGQKVLDIFHLTADDSACGYTSPQVNNTLRPECLNYTNFDVNEFDTLQFGANVPHDFKTSPGPGTGDHNSELGLNFKSSVATADRPDDIPYSSTDVLHDADLQPHDTNSIVSHDNLMPPIAMDKDNINVGFVGSNGSRIVNEHVGMSNSRPYRYCDDQHGIQSETESNWHCHNKDVEEKDHLARNQLIVVCVLCATFMIGEGVGMCIFFSYVQNFCIFKIKVPVR